MQKLVMIIVLLITGQVTGQSNYEKGMTKAFDLWKNEKPVEASNLFSDETIINHYGTGELNVYSSIYLRGWINHTGNVYYNGSPKTIDVDEFNSGELIEK